MTQKPEKRIFARTDGDDFIGRTAEIERLVSHAREGSGALALLAAPSAGASELLRQVYDRLFYAGDEVIPIYFEIGHGDLSSRDTALRFLREFLLQTVAFRRNDANIIDASPEICEITELALPADGHWIDRLVDTCDDGGKLNDDRSFIRNCLSAPLRGAAYGVRPFVMIGDLHTAAFLDDGEAFVENLTDIFGRASIPFVLAGHRRFLFPRTRFEQIALDALSFAESGTLAERLAAKTGIAINDQTRDLIAVQLGGRPGYIESIFATAATLSSSLNSFEQVEKNYTQTIFGGSIGKHLDAAFDRITPDAAAQFAVLRLLFACISARGGKIPASYWKKYSSLAKADFEKTIDALHNSEIVNLNSGRVEMDAGNTVLTDYIRIRARLEIDGFQRAFVFGEAASEHVKRAPLLMSRFYRRNAAFGLRELMQAFDGRQISSALIDYGRFSDQFKGAENETIQKALNEANEKIHLPRIVFAAHASAFYPKLNDLCDAERSAVGIGFEDDNETVWIAAEIDSKLEANRDLTEFWCDRLEMVALSCNFPQFKLWLVSPEGFDPDALAVLRERNALGSSRRQAALLAGMLGAGTPSEAKENVREYEIVVPMGEDTEMIAANAIEDIARRHHFPAKAINQIKTALVEACINAAEHSLSPDRRIYQKFSVEPDKITITVSNRGLRIADKAKSEPVPNEGRRGWGLKLIKGLMDDVKIEQTDDGTRITMVKYLKLP